VASAAEVEIQSQSQAAPQTADALRPLLHISHATKIYGGGLLQGPDRTVALRDLSLAIAERPATITTIAGESGSGKTTLANAILAFLTLTSGQILYRGTDVAQLSGSRMMAYRREVQAIFQDPYEVYNPFYRIQHTFDLVIRLRAGAGQKDGPRVDRGGVEGRWIT